MMSSAGRSCPAAEGEPSACFHATMIASPRAHTRNAGDRQDASGESVGGEENTSGGNDLDTKNEERVSPTPTLHLGAPYLRAYVRISSRWAIHQMARHPES